MSGCAFDLGYNTVCDPDIALIGAVFIVIVVLFALIKRAAPEVVREE